MGRSVIFQIMVKTKENPKTIVGQNLHDACVLAGFRSIQAFCIEKEIPWNTIKELVYGPTSGVTKSLEIVSRELNI